MQTDKKESSKIGWRKLFITWHSLKMNQKIYMNLFDNFKNRINYKVPPTFRKSCPADHIPVLITEKYETANMIALKMAPWERWKGKGEAQNKKKFLCLNSTCVPHGRPSAFPWGLPNVWFGSWDRGERSDKGVRRIQMQKPALLKRKTPIICMCEHREREWRGKRKENIWL